jgi:hypothetical protein
MQITERTYKEFYMSADFYFALEKNAEQVNVEDLFALGHSPCLALVLKNFYPRPLCEHVARIVKTTQRDAYAIEPRIERVGRAIFDAANNPAALTDYYACAPEMLRFIRKKLAPYAAPGDLLRLWADEMFPAGAQLARFHPPKLVNFGLVRHFGVGAEALPHEDHTEWDIPDNEAAQRQTHQFAANIYVETAAEGGELQLWNKGHISSEDYRADQIPGSYSLDPQKLGPPMVSIAPEVGDLVIFNCRLAHAVRTVLAGCRIAVSCFIGVENPDRPLQLYS